MPKLKMESKPTLTLYPAIYRTTYQDYGTQSYTGNCLKQSAFIGPYIRPKYQQQANDYVGLFLANTNYTQLNQFVTPSSKRIVIKTLDRYSDCSTEKEVVFSLLFPEQQHIMRAAQPWTEPSSSDAHKILISDGGLMSCVVTLGLHILSNGTVFIPRAYNNNRPACYGSALSSAQSWNFEGTRVNTNEFHNQVRVYAVATEQPGGQMDGLQIWPSNQ